MKNNIKAQSLSLSTVIIIILVLLVLVVLGYIFIKGFDGWESSMGSCLTKGGKCQNGCDLGRTPYQADFDEDVSKLCKYPKVCCVNDDR